MSVVLDESPVNLFRRARRNYSALISGRSETREDLKNKLQPDCTLQGIRNNSVYLEANCERMRDIVLLTLPDAGTGRRRRSKWKNGDNFCR